MLSAGTSNTPDIIDVFCDSVTPWNKLFESVIRGVAGVSSSMIVLVVNATAVGESPGNV